VRLSQDARQELLRKFREMIGVIKEAEEGESEAEDTRHTIRIHPVCQIREIVKIS
jgi:hypothetical protein